MVHEGERELHQSREVRVVGRVCQTAWGGEERVDSGEVAAEQQGVPVAPDTDAGRDRREVERERAVRRGDRERVVVFGQLGRVRDRVPAAEVDRAGALLRDHGRRREHRRLEEPQVHHAGENGLPVGEGR